MKALLFILIFTSFAHASPLQQMDQRLNTYADAAVVCEPGKEILSDDGLFIEVSCDFKCKDLVPRVERVKGTFLPKKLGLFAGNGSTEVNTLWSALGISLKIWSQKICLEKAAVGCKSAQNVDSFGVKELESGAWKMHKFPGCHEKSIIVSPFNNTSGSVRVQKITSMVAEPDESSQTIDFQEAGLKISLTSGDKKVGCKKLIKAHTCFGDCLDMARVDSEIVETLSTPGPLGSDELEMCGDELEAKLHNLNLSPSVRRELCESFFWQSFMKLNNRMYRSCAAIRGETTCDKF